MIIEHIEIINDDTYDRSKRKFMNCKVVYEEAPTEDIIFKVLPKSDIKLDKPMVIATKEISPCRIYQASVTSEIKTQVNNK